MNKYFNNVNTLEELRKQYKELLKKYPPDNGGDVAVMQGVRFRTCRFPASGSPLNLYNPPL